MNKNRLIFAAIITVVMLIASSLVMFDYYGPKGTITVEIDGKPGLAVVGSATVDGEERPIRATLPAKLTYEARALTFKIVPMDRDILDIDLDARIIVNGEVAASSGGYGLKGDVFRPVLLLGWRLNAFVFAMNKAEIAGPQK